MSGATHLIDQAKFSSRPLSVLIADEDRAVRESCRQAAEGMGFAAAAAEDFPALLRRLSLRVTDLVVAGIDLPGAEFPAMVSSIMALQPGVEVVLTGPQSSPDSILHAIKSGHHGFLLKPFRVQEFLSLLQKVAARRQFPSAFPATDGHVRVRS
ncbi:MAG TPA: response regulator [Terriglobales bacterium]|nr:response regulator [Terriglobales bacterium]